MTGGAWTKRTPRRERQSRLFRAARDAGLVLYGFLVAVGALFDPASVLFGAPMAVGGYWFVVSLPRRVGDDLPQQLHPALAAAVAGGLPAALSGASVTGAWGALAVGILVVEAAVLLVHWVGTDAPAPPLPGAGRDVCGGYGLGTGDEHLVRQALSAMPTEFLFDEWEATHARLTAGIGDPLGEVRCRDLLIEELRSRDPAGAARWLIEGPADLPDLYIRPDGSGN